jgi:hypothetical protein
MIGIVVLLIIFVATVMSGVRVFKNALVERDRKDR